MFVLQKRCFEGYALEINEVDKTMLNQSCSTKKASGYMRYVVNIAVGYNK